MSAVVTTVVSADGALVRLRFSETPGNVLSLALVGALRRALDAVSSRQAVKLIALEGEGRDFSFGASIPEHRPEWIDRVLPETHQLVRDLLRAPAPTAAIVRGRCVGGAFELALACDFILAANTAVMGLPEIALGVFPPAGSALLPLRVGASRAADAVLTGASKTAREWFEVGLVVFTADEPKLDAAVDRWFATHLAPRSAVALRHAADASRSIVRAMAEPAIVRAEQLYLETLMKTRDAVEGVEAFIAKRAPKWENR